MNKVIAGAAIGLVAMCLAACDGATDEDAATIGKAEGEILPRSVTDDMLPYDTARSQPPLAAPEDGETSGGAGSQDGGDGEASPSETAASQPPEEPAGGPPQPMPGAE